MRHRPAFPRHSRLAAALLGWFKRRARPLPWRSSCDPYRVWVSEVMLQQTQVNAVVPYYLRFLRAFPTARRLAASPRDAVLRAWSGLGYYRRARNLHEAAKLIVERHGGRLPDEYASLRRLPGVGDYTARAILSIAYNRPFAVLDGNVARVVARLFGIRAGLAESRFRRRVAAELAKMLPPREAGRFNQALMELGQTICRPRAPRCSACCLRRHCVARRTREPESFPAPRPRRAGETHHLALGLAMRGGRAALVRGLDGGLLADVWNFPSGFGKTPARAVAALRLQLAELFGPRLRLSRPLAAFRHQITFRSIRCRVYPAVVASGAKSKTVRWMELRRVGHAAVSELTRKAAGVAGAGSR